MNFTYILISSALTYFFVKQISNKDKDNKLKRLYSLFAVILSALFAVVMFKAGQIDGNAWNILLYTGVIYTANHLVGKQLLDKLLSRVK